MNRVTLEEWTAAFLAASQAVEPSDRTSVSTLEKLCGEMAALVGTAGADALLTRAIQRAHAHRADPPALPEGVPGREGLGEFLHAIDPALMNEVALSIGGEMLALMAGFIGDTLTRNLLARLSTKPRETSQRFGRKRT